MKVARTLCAALILSGIFSCTSPDGTYLISQAEAKSPLASPLASGALRVHRLWSRHLWGYISDLNLSGDGNALLVATIPNYDSPHGDRKAYLRYFNIRGKQLWRKFVPTHVRSQTLSSNGSLVVATTHDDKLLAFNSKGKKLWEARGTCKPILVESRHEVICYHNDDAGPKVAFDVFDWKGKKKLSFPIHKDILALKLSSDERHVSIALVGGEVLLLNSHYHVQWRARVPGEIVDLSVSEGVTPRVAVIYTKRIKMKKTGPLPPNEQEVSLLENGKFVARGRPAGHVSEISIAPDRSTVITYGNGVDGQFTSLMEIRSSGHGRNALKSIWVRRSSKNARYTSNFYWSEKGRATKSSLRTPAASMAQIIFDYEQTTRLRRTSWILSLNRDGALLWKLPVIRALGAGVAAHYYNQSWSENSQRIALTADDGTLGVFQVEKAPGK